MTAPRTHRVVYRECDPLMEVGRESDQLCAEGSACAVEENERLILAFRDPYWRDGTDPDWVEVPRWYLIRVLDALPKRYGGNAGVAQRQSAPERPGRKAGTSDPGPEQSGEVSGSNPLPGVKARAALAKDRA